MGAHLAWTVPLGYVMYCGAELDAQGHSLWSWPILPASNHAAAIAVSAGFLSRATVQMDWEQVTRDYQIVSRMVECLPTEMTSLSPECHRQPIRQWLTDPELTGQQLAAQKLQRGGGEFDQLEHSVGGLIASAASSSRTGTLCPATVTRIMIQRHAATDISPVC
jgi:hypothetical protein